LALVAAAVRATVGPALRAVRQLPQLARVLSALAAQAGPAAPRSGPRAAFHFAPRTPLNGTIGRARTLATLSLPLPAVVRVADRHQVTVNDVVLAPARRCAAISPPVRIACRADDRGRSRCRARPATRPTTLATMAGLAATDVADCSRGLPRSTPAPRRPPLTRELRAVIPTDLCWHAMAIGAAAALRARS
jgi:hypothetical protein